MFSFECVVKPILTCLFINYNCYLIKYETFNAYILYLETASALLAEYFADRELKTRYEPSSFYFYSNYMRQDIDV